MSASTYERLTRVQHPGFNLVPLAIVVWPTAILADSVGPLGILPAAVVAGVILILPHPRLRMAGIAIGLCCLILMATTSHTSRARNQIDDASAAGAIIHLDVRAHSSPHTRTHDGGRARDVRAEPMTPHARVGTKHRELPAGTSVLVVIHPSTLVDTEVHADAALHVSGTMQRRGSLLVIDAARIQAASPEAVDRWDMWHAVEQWRLTIRALMREATGSFPNDEAALVRGFTLGDTEGLSESATEAMRISGLTHLVAVSGANVALVYAGIALPLLYAGVRRTVRVSSAAVAIILYACAVGEEPSLIRAATMAAPLIIARLIGFRTPPIRALALAVLTWSLLAPHTASHVGFILSVLATAAIVEVSPRLAQAIHDASGARISERLALIVAVPAAAQLACTPVLILMRPELSIWTVPVNIAAAFVVAPATVFGFVGGCLASVYPPAATVVLYLSAVGAHGLLVIAEVSAQAPGARMSVPGGARGAIAAALIVGALVCALRMRHVRGVRAFMVAAVSASLVVWGLQQVPWTPRAWHIALCDVGQGHALVVRSDSDALAPVVLVDTGADEQRLTGCLRELGVKRIDLAIITHPHSDHNGAVGALSGSLSPAHLWVCPLDQITQTRLTHASTLHVPRAGESHVLTAAGSSKAASHDDTGLSIDVMWPHDEASIREIAAGESGGTDSVVNDCSIATRITVRGISVVELGDLEPQAQETLAESGVREADIVLVAHHGSRRQHQGLYRQLNPAVTLIGVGPNTYGHPHPDALAMFAHTPVYRSDLHGHILIEVLESGELRIEPSRR